jgi:hypothetical protein
VTAFVAWLPLADAEPLESPIRIAAIVATALMVGIVLELVRRRRLAERYALLWMSVTVALLILAVWNDLLGWIAGALGFALAANFLFVTAFGFAFILLLHFSVATSRLSDEVKILAQENARLDQELRAMRAGTQNGDGAGNGADPAEALSAPEAGSAPAPSSPADPPESA